MARVVYNGARESFSLFIAGERHEFKKGEAVELDDAQAAVVLRRSDFGREGASGGVGAPAGGMTAGGKPIPEPTQPHNPESRRKLPPEQDPGSKARGRATDAGEKEKAIDAELSGEKPINPSDVKPTFEAPAAAKPVPTFKPPVEKKKD